MKRSHPTEVCLSSRMLRILSALILANLLKASVTDEESFKVRLGGDPDRCSGRVEVLWNGMWGTLCDDYWPLENVAVVCRELGCGTAVQAPANCFAHGEGRHMLGHMLCQGDEHFLYQCKRRGFNLAHPCNFVNLTVGVVCADLHNMQAPSLHLEPYSGTVVRPGQTFRLKCSVPQCPSMCCSFYVTLSHNGGDIAHHNISGHTYTTFTIPDAQPWHAGDYQCRYSYQSSQRSSPSSNTINITVRAAPDAVTVWVVPVSATVGVVLLLIVLVVVVYCLLKRQRSS